MNNGKLKGYLYENDATSGAEGYLHGEDADDGGEADEYEDDYRNAFLDEETGEIYEGGYEIVELRLLVLHKLIAHVHYISGGIVGFVTELEFVCMLTTRSTKVRGY